MWPVHGPQSAELLDEVRPGGGDFVGASEADRGLMFASNSFPVLGLGVVACLMHDIGSVCRCSKDEKGVRGERV